MSTDYSEAPPLKPSNHNSATTTKSGAKSYPSNPEQLQEKKELRL
jgi:hypothetical protein